MFKWIFIAGIGFTLVMVGVSVANNYNTAIDYETSINATYGNNENVLASVGQKIFGSARVADKYKDGVVESVKAAISGRYGAPNTETGDTGGSKQAWLWVKEQNPTLDPSLYTKIQQVIESGQDEFKNNQTLLLDKCRGYENMRKRLLSGTILKLVGFPTKPADVNDPNATPAEKVTFAKKCTIISTNEASEAFSSGKQQPLNF